MKKLLVIIPLVLLLGNLNAFDVENPRPWIRSELKRLGFDTATIAPHIGGLYTVQITGFKPSSPTLSLEGRFRPFLLHVKPVEGKLYIDQANIVREGYKLSMKTVPGGSSIVMSKGFRKYFGTSNRELSQIKATLSSAKDYKMRGRIKIANVLSKSRIVESLIADCSVPNPATDIPKMRAKLNQLGLQTGDIQLMEGKKYKIRITGASPNMKLKFASGAFKPIVLEGMFIKEKLYIEKESWAAGIISPPTDKTRSVVFVSWDVADSLPRFGVSERRDYSYDYCADCCSCYVGNSVTAKNNARRRYEFLEDVLSEVERMRDYMEDRCARNILTDSEKSSLHRSLTGLIDQAERQKGEFDKYIEDIERFIKDYNDCKANEPISP